MNIAGLRSIGSAVLLLLLAGAGCNRPQRASSESGAAPTPQGVSASITAHALTRGPGQGVIRAFLSKSGPPGRAARSMGRTIRFRPTRRAVAA